MVKVTGLLLFRETSNGKVIRWMPMSQQQRCSKEHHDHMTICTRPNSDIKNRQQGDGFLPPGLQTSSSAAVRCSWQLWRRAPLHRFAPRCTDSGLPKISAYTGIYVEDKTLIHDFLYGNTFQKLRTFTRSYWWGELAAQKQEQRKGNKGRINEKNERREREKLKVPASDSCQRWPCQPGWPAPAASDPPNL